ncbi:MAG: thioredoxin domain-containing protein [Thermoplasmata archaeon]|nr:thioredoxin domain-containing protein [Thermoplasmata archaeon]
MAAESAEKPEREGAWRLAGSSSVYLQSAREQAIDWYPWGEEAFEAARRLNRPVLLDIGAVWCHWCHVMDEGTYSDAEVARLIGQHFVAVKVDRDANPEVDRRYQRQVNALTGEGGWPLTAFLTAKGETFFGGTYFPAQEGLGRPGFRRVLLEISRLWRDEPEKVRENTRSLATALTHEHHGTGRTGGPSSSAFIDSVRASMLTSFDPVNGGFGTAPKFPHPTAISFLLWDSFSSGSEGSAQGARLTLSRMADGGMYDHIGGGFHRYSVDEGWHIPHFEKMSVDNAALLSAYAEGYRRFQDEGFRGVVRGTVDWMESTLADSNGGFGASQDADNAPGDDGGYFTWSRPELKAVLDPSELRLIARYFGVGSQGRMPHDPDRNVLFRLMTVEEAAEGTGLDATAARASLARALEKLQTARSRRSRPVVDPALYAHLNGGFIRALTAASVVLDDSRLLTVARRAADRFLAEAYSPSRGVAHRLGSDRAHGFGHLEDQAEFAWALVELAGQTLEPKYVSRAVELYELIGSKFRVEGMPLRDIAPDLYDGPSIGAVADPSFPIEDMPHLSANASVALGLLRLASLTGADRWRVEARELIGSCLARLERAGLYGGGMALAAGLSETEPIRIVVQGRAADARALWRAAQTAWHPNVWAFRETPPPPFSLPEELAAAATSPAEARALVCWGMRCAPPVTDPERLRSLVASRSAPGPAA